MPESQKKSNVLLYAGIGGGVFLLLTCGCLGGVGGWFFFLRTPAPETTLLGKWTIDVDATNKLDPRGAKDIEGLNFEFQEYGGFITTYKKGLDLGKWKKIESKGDTVVIEVRDSKNEAERLTVKVLDSNHLRFSSGKGEPDFVMKRI